MTPRHHSAAPDDTLAADRLQVVHEPSPAEPPAEGAVATSRSGVWSTIAAYVALTKPRVIELLLWVTVPTMILADRGWPGWFLVMATLVGGFAAAGSANAYNCYIDRDIDQVMARTKRRPLVTGEVSPRGALVFATVLGVFSLAWFGVLVNWLSSVLALIAILFYVFVYTLGLKRRTAQNIVWGGAAGCMPVLIGWAAVTNSLSWAALVLFMIIFLWTPPHYWPLSMKYAGDYEAVGVPMLGAVAEPKAVVKQIVLYSWAMVACSLVLIPVAPMGWTYSIAAVVLGAWFLIDSYVLKRGVDRGAPVKPMRLFHLSIMYLSLLFVAIAADPFLPGF